MHAEGAYTSSKDDAVNRKMHACSMHSQQAEAPLFRKDQKVTYQVSLFVSIKHDRHATIRPFHTGLGAVQQRGCPVLTLALSWDQSVSENGTEVSQYSRDQSVSKNGTSPILKSGKRGPVSQ